MARLRPREGGAVVRDLDNTMEGARGVVAAANMPPRDEESASLQRATNLSDDLTRASRRFRRGVAKICGQEGGADKPPAAKPSGDISVAPEAASARAASSNAAGAASKPRARAAGNVRPFPATEPTKRKIACLDEAAFEKGFDSDGHMPYYHDYGGDSDDDSALGGGCS